ncbi:MAG: hypothetical protein KDB14_01580 [Planctomycetales bacterium]|nr:hypothetical protein [Planctomycetales bacterium]
MQLDRTSIAIRERGMLESFDLALHVARIHFVPLLVLATIGILPFLLIDRLALGWLVLEDPRDYSPSEYAVIQMRYIASLVLLIFVQAPLATAMMTTWLGHAVFAERPPIAYGLKKTYGSLAKLLWCQGLLRLTLPITLSFCWLSINDDGVELFVLFLLSTYLALVRSLRPFLNEIVLLEGNPLGASADSHVVTVAKRNASLHEAAGGALFFEFIGSGMLATCLTIALFYTFVFLQGIMLNRWRIGPTLLLYGLPASLWASAMLLTVFRFLCYLDLRIRQEGWAVELGMRAEAARLKSDLMAGA